MDTQTTWLRRRHRLMAAVITLTLILAPAAEARVQSEAARFQRSIVDYRARLNPRFKKIKREKTKYIIVHTAELGLKSTLRVVSQGKRFRSGRRTHGGHAHYVIARNGRTYRILDKQYVADHAGRSMWDGDTDISSISIGIELVGYHYAPIAPAQYRSVGQLIDILQRVYGLDDRAVLTHSQVAYGRPNRWHRQEPPGPQTLRQELQPGQSRPGADLALRSRRACAAASWRIASWPRSTTARNFTWPRPRKPMSSPRSIRPGSLPVRISTATTTVYKFPDGRLFTGTRSPAGWAGTACPPKRSSCSTRRAVSKS
jgi:hypothetical protein